MSGDPEYYKKYYREHRNQRALYNKKYYEGVVKFSSVDIANINDATKRIKASDILKNISYKELVEISNRENIGLQVLKSIKMGIYEPTEEIYNKIIKYCQ
jgi:hypothetical protein